LPAYISFHLLTADDRISTPGRKECRGCGQGEAPLLFYLPKWLWIQSMDFGGIFVHYLAEVEAVIESMHGMSLRGCRGTVGSGIGNSPMEIILYLELLMCYKNLLIFMPS
jgi:hypothetical protein